MPSNQAPLLNFDVKVLDLLAVRNQAVDQLYKNNGDATFGTTPQTLDGVAADSQSRGADVADLDGDGDLDAVVAYGYFGPSTVWLNDGTGNLVSTGQGIGSADVQNVTLADFDGDGDIDAFLAACGPSTQGRASQVYLNDGTGYFALSSTVGNASSFDSEAADLDGDGDMDLVVANGPQGINLTPSQAWINDGDGNFSLGFTFEGDMSWDVAVGDVNGDGEVDAVFANNGGGRATLYLGDGDGTFTEVPDALSATTATHSGITLADLDGDGDLDLVQVFSDKNAEVLLNDGAGNFTSTGQTDIAAFGWRLTAGDLDDDGDLDIVSTWELGEEALWINDGTGHFTIQSNFLAADKIFDVQLGAFRSQVSATAPSLEFNEGDVIAVLPAALVTDDGATLSSATLTISGGFAGSGDLLQAVTGSTGISASFANNVLTLSGVASLADYQQVLRSVTFSSGSNPTDGETHNSRTISVVLNDGGANGQSAAVEVEIVVSDDNQAPQITSGGGGETATYSVNENTAAVATIVADDADNDALTYSISGGADALLFSIDATTGALRFVNAPDYEQAADADGDNVYLVEVSANDGDENDSQSIAVTVLNVSGVTIIGNKYANTVSDTVTVPGQPYASDEDDYIYGRAGNDTLSGLGGNDRLMGEDGADTLNGGDGDDLLDGGSSFDTMLGGKGDDYYIVDNRCDVVIEADDEGTDTVQSGMNYRLDANVENLVLTGSGAITGIGNGLANSITGSSYANTLIGLGGADALDGGGGLDTASYADSALGVNVSLKTGLGHGGDAEGDTLVRIENLIGSSKADTLEGDDGANVLAGGAGKDTLSYEHASAAVTVDLSKTTAQATGGSGLDRISGFENLTGSGFGDKLTGDKSDNVLSGLGGSDTMSGGKGNDVLDGGFGSDWLTGGAGSDRFVFKTFGDGVDRITDFATRSDKLEIDAAAFGGGLVAGGSVDLAFAGSAGAASHGAGGYFIFDNTGADKGTLYWDANGGSGSDAVAIAVLTTGTLAAGDFLFI